MCSQDNTTSLVDCRIYYQVFFSPSRAEIKLFGLIEMHISPFLPE